MAAKDDQAYLDDLLAGLDPADFSSCLLSSSPPRSSQPKGSATVARKPLSQKSNTLSQHVPKRGLAHVKLEIDDKENQRFEPAQRAQADVKLAAVKPLRASPPPRKRARIAEQVTGSSVVRTNTAPSITATGSTPQCKQFVRALVESVQSEYVAARKANQKVLQVSLPKTTGAFKVVLQDDWQQCEIEMGDTINIVGPFDRHASPAATISRSEGFLIVHPDILVSATKVADSSHCARKAVLQEIIRSSSATTSALLYGNMLHELMQQCMLHDEWDDDFRRSKTTELLEKELQTLWSIDLPVNTALDEMLERSNTFRNFSETFMSKSGKGATLSDPRATHGKEENVAIRSTIDIEEDVWSPRFGLKGKIDVSVDASVHATHAFALEDRKPHPFEIKTGKSAAGMEHRAQTMLYTLLVTDRYDQIVDTGLLYYTRTNEVFKVPASRNELRGLVLARNEFALFLHRRMTLSNEVIGALSLKGQKQEEPDEFDLFSSPPPTSMKKSLLPAPIDDERSCARCYVGEACMLYRKALDYDSHVPLEEGSELRALYDKRTEHLDEADTLFFKKWEGLISLEEQELVRHRKEIWTMSAEERMAIGRCIADLQVDESFVEPVSVAKGSKSHRFTYCLRVRQSSQWTSSQRNMQSLHGGNLSVGDPVVVSLEEPAVLAISRGFVLDISHDAVSLGLDHSLIDLPQLRDPRYADIDRVYRVDKDELAAGMGRIRDNVIQLFVENGDEKRRRLIVQLDAPRFEEHPLLTYGSASTPNLNRDQVAAIDKVARAQDYTLILGMPGTGKTTAIAELIRVLVANKKSVLLTSYTHSAVDNILLKLAETATPSILRLGNRDKIMPSLHKYTLEQLDSALSMHELDRLLMEPSVVATTCLSINEPIFTRRRFDYCIVDEASQVTLPACIGPLRYADKFVLVGDHKQLPPLVRNADAKAGGLEDSLFKILTEAHPQASVELSFQYRMNEDIMHLSNTLVYNNTLKAGNTMIASRKLLLPDAAGLDSLHRSSTCPTQQCWLRDLLSESRNVVFVNTDKCPAPERKQGSLIDNETEATLCAQTTAALVASGVKEKEIGIITLYRQQIKTIGRKIERFPGVEILTADRSQGRDKSCIIMSLTRSNDRDQSGDLLKDWRRINVCLTRAKAKLIMFGSRSTLSKVLEPLFKIIDQRSWSYDLPIDAHKQLL